MRLITFAAAAIATAVFGTPSWADKPDGTFVFKENANSQGSNVGKASSQIIQNGQFVSGNNDVGIDQTTTPGSRADAVQELHMRPRVVGAPTPRSKTTSQHYTEACKGLRVYKGKRQFRSSPR